MGRTLSGLRDGVFDTITTEDLETTGTLTHTGNTMVVGAVGHTGVALTVNGNIGCTGFVNTDGLESELTFKTPGLADVIYDGGTEEEFVVNIPTITYQKNDGSAAVVYDGTGVQTFTESANTIVPGITYNKNDGSSQTYGGTVSATFTETPQQTLTVKHRDGSAYETYDGSTEQTIHIPRLGASSLTNGSAQSFNVPESAALISSGFGISLAPAASTSYLVEVQCWCENSTANSETITLVLSKSKSSASLAHASRLVYEGKQQHKLVVFRTVLTLAAGSHEIGLAFKTESRD